jgi:hypothetical protein
VYALLRVSCNRQRLKALRILQPSYGIAKAMPWYESSIFSSLCSDRRGLVQLGQSGLVRSVSLAGSSVQYRVSLAPCTSVHWLRDMSPVVLIRS